MTMTKSSGTITSATNYNALEKAYFLRSRTLAHAQIRIFELEEAVRNERMRAEELRSQEAAARSAEHDSLIRDAAERKCDNTAAPVATQQDLARTRECWEQERGKLFQSIMRRDVELSKTRTALQAATQSHADLTVAMDRRFREITYITGRTIVAEDAQAAAVLEAKDNQQAVKTAQIAIENLQRDNETLSRILKETQASSEQELTLREDSLAAMSYDRDVIAAQLAEARAEIQELRASTSWKITAPARRIMSTLRNGRG